MLLFSLSACNSSVSHLFAPITPIPLPSAAVADYNNLRIIFQLRQSPFFLFYQPKHLFPNPALHYKILVFAATVSYFLQKKT